MYYQEQRFWTNKNKFIRHKRFSANNNLFVGKDSRRMKNNLFIGILLNIKTLTHFISPLENYPFLTTPNVLTIKLPERSIELFKKFFFKLVNNIFDIYNAT